MTLIDNIKIPFLSVFYNFKFRSLINKASIKINNLIFTHNYIQKLEVFNKYSYNNKDQYEFYFQISDSEKQHLKLHYENIQYLFHFDKKLYFSLDINKPNQNSLSNTQVLYKYSYMLSVKTIYDQELLSYYELLLIKVNSILDEVILELKNNEPTIYNDIFNKKNILKQKDIKNTSQLISLKSNIPQIIKSGHLYNNLQKDLPDKPSKIHVQKI